MTTTFDPPRGGARTGTGRQLWSALEGHAEDFETVSEIPLFALEAGELTQLIRVAEQAKARVEALQARLVAEADRRDLARDAGGSSTSAWLQALLRTSPGVATRVTATARVLEGERVAATRATWAEGRISSEQARVIADALSKVSADVELWRVAAAEADLILQAQEFDVPQLRRLANRVVEVIDPDHAEEILGDRLEAEEERARQQAMLRFSRRGDGTTGVSGRLPDAHADMFKKVLEAFGSPRRRSALDGERSLAGGVRPVEDGVGPVEDGVGPVEDGVGPVEDGVGSVEDGVGSSPVLNPDGDHSQPITYGNRLGLALMEMVEHLPTERLPQSGGVSATVVVSMTLDQLRSGLGTAVLDTGIEVSAGQARRLACNAHLVPLVLGGDSTVLDAGMARRLFDRYQRLVLAHRDRGCVWRGCARPPAWCEAHHPHPWSEGGPTDVSNGALLCPFHHRLLHTSDWALRMAPDGVPEIIPPARIDEQRRPLRHERFMRPPRRRRP